MNSRIAVFPGSFDPITLGHIDIIERAAPLFDKIIVSIGNNSQKKYLFSLEKRMQWLSEIFEMDRAIEISHFEGLTVDFCNKVHANYILRGIRNSIDFEYEKTIALVNKSMYAHIETVFYVSSPPFAHVSSSIVRELIKYKGNIEHLVPACVSRDALK